MTTIVIDENCREGKAFIDLLRQMKFARVLDNGEEWWPAVSPVEQQAIDEGLSDIEQGHTQSHEQVKNLYEQWLQN